MRALLIVAALALTGCATPQRNLWKPEASLLVSCEEPVKLMAGDGTSITLWATAFRKQYETCAARHQRLVEAIPKGD